jgi:hypothetical protein
LARRNEGLAEMIRKRSRYNALEPSNEPTWLLVENQYTELVFAKEYPPLANRVHIMIEALAMSVAKGWEVECLPGDQPLYFCHKGQYRHCVHIGASPAADRMSAYQRRRASRTISSA